MIALNDAFFLHAVPEGWVFLSADAANGWVTAVLLRTGGARGPVHAYGMGDTLAQAHNNACVSALLEGGAV